MQENKPEVLVAKTSGFCFGVKQAVNIVENLLAKGETVCTLGPIIHNPQVIEGFLKRSGSIINNVDSMPNGGTLVIRAHGITKSEFENIKSRGVKHIDATCPFVKKIHKLVEAESSNSGILLLAGNSEHPEVKGIVSYFKGKSIIFNALSQLEKIINENPDLKYKPAIMVAQTTFSVTEWKKCINFIKKHLTGLKIFDTICNTTGNRQLEAKHLSEKCNLMLVIGGRESSNTRKLYDICAQQTQAFLIENFEELYNLNFSGHKKIGIVAGASTPMSFVHEIYEYVVKQNS